MWDVGGTIIDWLTREDLERVKELRGYVDIWPQVPYFVSLGDYTPITVNFRFLPAQIFYASNFILMLQRPSWNILSHVSRLSYQES